MRWRERRSRTSKASMNSLRWSSWLWRGLNTAEVPGSIPGFSIVLLLFLLVNRIFKTHIWSGDNQSWTATRTNMYYAKYAFEGFDRFHTHLTSTYLHLLPLPHYQMLSLQWEEGTEHNQTIPQTHNTHNKAASTRRDPQQQQSHKSVDYISTVITDLVEVINFKVW